MLLPKLLFYALCAAVLILSACTPQNQIAGSTDAAALGQSAPDGAHPGSCWHKQTKPAVIETVERTVLVQPAQVTSDGLIQQPAIYRKERAQQIIRPRATSAFEVPCPAALTPEFIATLQRALAARDLYSGPISGQMSARTGSAVRAYQTGLGVQSDVLSMVAARKLGLIPVSRAATLPETQ